MDWKMFDRLASSVYVEYAKKPAQYWLSVGEGRGETVCMEGENLAIEITLCEETAVGMRYSLEVYEPSPLPHPHQRTYEISVVKNSDGRLERQEVSGEGTREDTKIDPREFQRVAEAVYEEYARKPAAFWEHIKKPIQETRDLGAGSIRVEITSLGQVGDHLLFVLVVYELARRPHRNVKCYGMTITRVK